jgi:ketosteroid isomerase-like protein
MTTNIEIVQQAYAAFAKGDVAGILANLDPEIVWENPGPDTIAYFGWHRGHAAVATNIFGFLHENMQFSVFEPYEFLVSADRVAVLLRVQSSVPRTGAQLKEEAVHVFTFKNGKVVRFQDFQNSYNVAKALGA